MKRNWTIDELVDSWTLLPNELELVGNKTGPTRLGFALLLKFFQLEARFPAAKNEIPRSVVDYVAKQVNVEPDDHLRYDWRGRQINHHRVQIREFFGFREALRADVEALSAWLCADVLAQEQDLTHSCYAARATGWSCCSSAKANCSARRCSLDLRAK